MQVVDEITRKLINRNNAYLIVVKHIPGQLIKGYTKQIANLKTVYFYINNRFVAGLADINLFKDSIIYSVNKGSYISTVDLPEDILLKELHLKGFGEFPYTFNRNYEAVENFQLFKDKQYVVDNSITYELSKHLKYTFGLEFETSMGYIPEDICFRDGLIPLRDGSISGLEYSTVILEGNYGIQLVKQQLETLKKYTYFNKECALHIHFGGFPLSSDKLFKLYCVCHCLEAELFEMLPYYTFKTFKYKRNGKDYCRLLPDYKSFNMMYERLVGRKYFGDLTQPHPNDVERKRKWQISTR